MTRPTNSPILRYSPFGRPKYLISSTLPDGMYYEITYNRDKKEWYLDAYKKFENRCIPE